MTKSSENVRDDRKRQMFPNESDYNASVQPPDRNREPGSFAYAMRALGREDLPAEISFEGTTYRKTRDVKHDFFAATAFYANERGKNVVLKVGRTTDFAGISLAWLGAWLCRREVRFYRRLSHLPNVPPVLGLWRNAGFIHGYVDGAPLSKTRPIPDGFFGQLQSLLKELHTLGIAYVDTNKPENILQGDDGRPHLIDFQISFDLDDFGDNLLTRAFLRCLQREDLYHILKHKRRMRPDELTPDEQAIASRKSWFILLHRFVTRPYFLIRRRAFRKLRESGQLLPEGSK